ncbi:MAG: lytic transglycosylase domain-containing protein [Acidobacteria bacterium]|nr:MAG: lytic transglycosylase domain-containing protein [Acidobacteriota bacterium]
MLLVLVVFLAALAGTQLAPPDLGSVDWKEIGAPAGVTPEEVASLREELLGLREAIPANTPQALASLEPPARVDLCGQPLPLDRPEVRERLAYELLLTVGKPLMPMLWTRRAPAVLPEIEARLREAGLPDDLKYVAVAESDLRITVRSPAGAVGPWQLMKATARRYGLRVDRYVDERMDIERATDAAAAYFADLYEEFGDWFLALAAYNAGENAVRSAIEEQGRRDYFELYLPEETRRYVHRVVAAKLVFEQPERYGLARMTPLHVPRYRIVEVQVRPARADLRKLAAEHGLEYGALRRANPKLLGPWLPRGTHRLRVPVG